MTSVDSLIQDPRLRGAYKRAYDGSLHLGEVARNIVSEICSPLEEALKTLRRYEDQLPAVTSGAESVKVWEDGIRHVRSDLVRKNIPAEVLDKILYVVIDSYNERHLKDGIAYTAEEVSKNALVQPFGIDEDYIVRFISERFIGYKEKKVAGVQVNGVTYYGIRTKRDLDFVKRMLEKLKGKPMIHAQDLDIINSTPIGTLLSKNYKSLGLEQRIASDPIEYEWHNNTSYEGKLSEVVNHLIDTHPKIRIFVPAEIAYHFDTGTAPVTNIFRARIGFKEGEFRGKTAFRRIPQNSRNKKA